MEHKLLNLDVTQVKFDASNPREFTGYASVFNGIDAYGDTIAAGAYKDTLEDRERPVRMRWNHFGPVIGKWKELYEDEKGLVVKGELTPGHSVASDVAASMSHGAVTGLSIGYSVPDDGYEMRGNTRILKKINLVEISVVEEPADNMAHISGIKAAISECESLKEVEAILRDVGGFSRSNATALVSRVKALSLGDQVAKEDSSELSKQIDEIIAKWSNSNDRRNQGPGGRTEQDA